ncbi:MAG: phosphotransferase enzyme family protein [Acidimicrobiales bacterium]
MAPDTPAPGVLVHGMDGRMTAADWPPLRGAEVRRVLRCYGLDDPSVAVLWRSPRPFSAAAVLSHPGGRLFVKRHHRSVRTPSALAAEHRFMAHLAAGGVPVPEVLSAAGATAGGMGEWTYELHRPPPGEDLYRRAMSWEPFRTTGHAAAAGAALARLHRAAEGYEAPARPPGVLVACWASGADDLLGAVEGLVASRPALAEALARRPWRADVARVLCPWHPPLAAVAGRLRPQWTHNDWHASNLFWRPAGGGAEVSGVVDFGLSNRTTAVFDLATAVERHVVGWLEGDGARPVHLDQMAALVGGYRSVRPLEAAEAVALPALLPLVHLELALSELEYFEAVVRSPSDADLAYGAFLLGHAAWFATPPGRVLLDELRRVAEGAVVGAAPTTTGEPGEVGGRWPRT